MNIQESKDRDIIENSEFKQVAEQLKPQLNTKLQQPKHYITTYEDSQAIHGWNAKKIATWQEMKHKAYGKNESFIVDFNDHMAGFLRLNINPVGSPPDAPLHIKLTFGETLVEVSEPFYNYEGWLSSSWLQEEVFYVDVMPATITLPRRYSFRYLKVSVLDTSPKYSVSFDAISCKTVTSADINKIPPGRDSR